ncbi:LOW QUALITY PROTEIN: D-aspartate oxidase-like [Paramacrobiotus metropolitanus]|uniref:LOW QUALITY PROTEIN: D-aspartate oxidase-like n=1 Tax=Paramacrobiotus metropolitanus TaxID=2943436 RepID=UPI002445E621|nr:LOW QUALITY PROTEIN: D-aspartate oxidase-like [Paramacrobiotus metropolitanus]
MTRVAVVGAGIVGLSAAVCIQEHVPDAQVAIFADRQDVATTSDGAAGIFHPDCVGADNQADLKQWIADSAEKYWHAWRTKDPVETGIFEISGYSVSNHDLKMVADPVFHEHCRNYRRLEGAELDAVGGGPWRYGAFKTTLITEPRIMMPDLFNQFLGNGGQLVQMKLESLAPLTSGQWDAIVNCSGLGARNLVSDHSMYPIRGQVMRVRAPWMKQFYFGEDDAYILPNAELVVVGGTRQKNNWSLELCKEDRDRFVDKCAKMVPGIRETCKEPVREWVGLRPGRPTVRLEEEALAYGTDRSIPVVHNYGHSGNGIALSWGCGKHVARLVKDIAQREANRPRY